MSRLHPRAFTVSVVWTLVLLYLGSVVHATESSLACPDWPTCFGTMVPEMTGGVFWEHLHRLVAGGLLLMWCLAIWLVRKEAPDSPGLFRATLAGLGLLLIQSVFGGLTVLFKLPDLVSTTHLSLALLFLALATTLASRTSWSLDPELTAPRVAARVRRGALVGAGLVFLQSVLGGLVRHTDAGMACPDAPLCLVQIIPPLGNHYIAIHFTHRAVGMLAALWIVGLAVTALRSGAPSALRTWTGWAAVLILFQVGLGFLSVLTALAVVPVSLHTLVAAGLLVTLIHTAVLAGRSAEATTPEPSAAAV